MIRRTPSATRTYTLLPSPTLFRSLRVGGAVLLCRPHAPAMALERTRRGPVRGAGVRCFPTAARRALRLPRCLDTDGLLAGCAAAASNHAGPRRGHAGCAECGRHSCRWRQVMVAADIFRPFPPRALAWLQIGRAHV